MSYYNPTLYPDDYPVIQDGTGLELLDTVTLIQRQARDTSIRLLMGQRLSSQGLAMIQGERARTYSHAMPLDQVGAAQSIPPKRGGTVAFLGGGRGHTPPGVGSWQTDGIVGFAYSNEIVFTVGSRLSEAASYLSTVWSPRHGYYCGGGTMHGWSNAIDSLDFRRLICKRIGRRLEFPTVASTGGIQNRQAGYLFGGAVWNGVNSYYSDRGTKFLYNAGSVPVVTFLGSKLTVPRHAPHNSISNKYNGYIFGGTNRKPWHDWDNAHNTIERFSIGPETSSLISATMQERHQVHAIFGTAYKCYIAGGTGVPPITAWFGDRVSRLTYDGEVYTALGSRLTEPKVCADGIGSSSFGYAVGGDTAGSGWLGTRTIDRMNYGNDTISRIGSRLNRSAADQGGTSDYAGGF